MTEGCGKTAMNGLGLHNERYYWGCLPNSGDTKKNLQHQLYNNLTDAAYKQNGATF